ncbi:MAG: hypothetical protein VKN33_08255 [Candidatus Sericytochromatia bacterium]|nr:hypothetical protein [Candidatus Sericytochromatia bacterium]
MRSSSRVKSISRTAEQSSVNVRGRTVGIVVMAIGLAGLIGTLNLKEALIPPERADLETYWYLHQSFSHDTAFPSWVTPGDLEMRDTAMQTR